MMVCVLQDLVALLMVVLRGGGDGMLQSSGGDGNYCDVVIKSDEVMHGGSDELLDGDGN